MPHSRCDWWDRARRLRAKGLSLPDIARAVRVHHTSVLYAVDDEFRAKQKKKIRNRKPRVKSPETKHREKVLAAARDEAERTTRNIDVVLQEWGEQPRKRILHTERNGGLDVRTGKTCKTSLDSSR